MVTSRERIPVNHCRLIEIFPDGELLTNLRLESDWYSEIDYCPFCGQKLTVEKWPQGREAKACRTDKGETFHFRIMPSEDGGTTEL